MYFIIKREYRAHCTRFSIPSSCQQIITWLVTPRVHTILASAKNKWPGPNLASYGFWMSWQLFMDIYSWFLQYTLLNKRIEGTLCPLSLLIFGPISFPWQHFPFVLADLFILMTHFISLMILPIVLTLLLAFVSYCCSIYGSHILSGPLLPYNLNWATLYGSGVHH